MRIEPKVIMCGRCRRHGIDASKLDDGALLARVLAHDEAAWRELVGRFGPDITRRMATMLGRYWRLFRATDTLDEMRSDFYFELVVNDMARLRAYDPAKGSLKRWLTLLAQHAASEHAKKLTRRPPPEAIDAYLDDEKRDPQRGARWIDEGL